jgi:hypothetical protein
MHTEALYALTRFFQSVRASVIVGWIDEPRLLEPVLLGVAEVGVTDQQTNRSRATLDLAVWRTSAPLLSTWPCDPGIPDGPIWLVTTWTQDPAMQHLLSVLLVTDDLPALIRLWPAAARAIPVNHEWLTSEDQSALVLATARF